jgi:hypothetical protein
MRVMIMKCSKEEAWWNKSIGKVVEVVREFDEDYLIKVKDKKKEGNHIIKADCVVLGR